LHYAIARKDVDSLKILLEAGADPSLQTRIDDCETALELAVRSGFEAGASLLSTRSRIDREADRHASLSRSSAVLWLPVRLA
jgi:ankyrin repeat protein